MTQKIIVRYSEEAKQQVTHLFGAAASSQMLAQAVGALDGATVDFSAGENTLVGIVHHRYVQFQQRLIKRDAYDQLYVRNLYFEKQSYAPPLTGLRALLNQIRAGQRLGIRYLSLSAAGAYGENELNGYYTWARYGFDAELDMEELPELPEHLAHVKTLNDLMEAGGASWWKENGLGLEMIFDLANDSSMMRTLTKYLAALRQQGRWKE